MSEHFEADLVFSCSENNFLPAADVWIVIDVLRATTVVTRWFELGGTELYPVTSTEAARQLVQELKARGSSPLLMGEVNGIPPEGFDLGNSPLDLNYDLIRKHYCGVMSTTNGTKALNEAASSGSPVIAACFRNYAAVLDYALNIGPRIGILCSGRKKRPSWEDALCAGAMLNELISRGETLMTDSAKIAAFLWQNRSGNLLEFVKISEHAKYLEGIGYNNDISFACEVNVSTVVPMLITDNKGHIILHSVSGDSRPYAKKYGAIKPEKPIIQKKADPFEELLNYTKKPSQYFFIGRKDTK